MVTGATIDQTIFRRGCIEASDRHQELLDVRDRMPSMTIEENAQYADLVIRTYGTDEEFVTEQLAKMKKHSAAPSASFIGALAYFSLNAPTESLRDAALQAYNRYNTPMSLLRQYCSIM